jgi:Ca-activated chloride channel family protein
MRHHPPTLSLLLLISIVFAALLFNSDSSVTSQTPNQNLNANTGHPSRKAIQLPATPTPTPESTAEVVKIDVDLVKIDALVLNKKTATAVGGLKKEDFLVYEDGTKQEITHFSRDELPLSVVLAIDRGEQCPIEPYADEVHRAAREAIDRFKPVDEIAVIAFADTTRLVQPFTRNRILIENALNKIPAAANNPTVLHCFNNLFADATDLMMKASNPAGRRVVIVITGRTRLFDCRDPASPSHKAATTAIYESGTVVCAIIPRVPVEVVENGLQTMATRMGKIVGADYFDLQNLANETGGEVLADKLDKLETTFQTLIDHLRSRYNLAFVSTNKKRDGTTRKLRLDLAPSTQKSQGGLVVKARRSYIAPRN